MASTYTLIASSTVGSGGASSIDFTSIPSTYTDLKIVISARLTGTGTSNYCNVKFNNNASNNVTGRILSGDGSSATSSTQSAYTTLYTGLLVNDGGSTSSTFSNTELYVPNYAGSNNKAISADNAREGNATFGDLNLTAGLWSSTSAINQVTLTPGTGNFAQYSTAYLYGIRNS